MTPKHRVELELDMDGTKYRLRLGTNQLCQIEAEVKKPWGEILYRDLNPLHLHLTTLRTVVRVASLIPLTDEQAGDLLDGVGFNGLMEQVRAAVLQQLVDAEAEAIASDITAKAESAEIH